MTKSRTSIIISYYAVYGLGLGVGFLIGRKYYKAKFEQLLEQEVALSKHYQEMKRTREAYAEREAEIALIEEVDSNDDGNPYDIPWDPCDLDYDEEMKHRSDEAPYVISKNEFTNDKTEYEKISLEYYSSEDILLDDRVDPIADADDIVGKENLKRFGHGSGDRRLVYIRNEELETDWEVRLMMGSYLIDVLGLDDPEDQGKRYERSD